MINFSAIPTQKSQTLRKKREWCSVKLFCFLKPWLGNQRRLSIMVCWNEKVRGYFPGYFLYSKMKWNRKDIMVCNNVYYPNGKQKDAVFPKPRSHFDTHRHFKLI